MRCPRNLLRQATNRYGNSTGLDMRCPRNILGREVHSGEFYRVRYALSPELTLASPDLLDNSTGLDMRCPRNIIFSKNEIEVILQG